MTYSDFQEKKSYRLMCIVFFNAPLSYLDTPLLTSFESSNSILPLPIVDNIPSYVKLNSRLLVKQCVKENDMSNVCATDGSCKSGRGLSYYIKYPKGEIEKPLIAGNNSYAQNLEITALHQCLVELSELDQKMSFHLLLRNLLLLTLIMVSCCDFIASLDSSIIIGKVPGHKGMFLNEKVNTMAKRATVRPVMQAVLNLIFFIESKKGCFMIQSNSQD
uniref:RNase H domain-containing protein n=1 Tax=Strongyloides venezuelensis TaxID=75913 RepID=A0A0K0F4I4_STRVS